MATSGVYAVLLLLGAKSLLEQEVQGHTRTAPDFVQRLIERSRRQIDQEQANITFQDEQKDSSTSGQLDQRLGTEQTFSGGSYYAPSQSYQPCVYQQPIKYYYPCQMYCPQCYGQYYYPNTGCNYYPQGSSSWSSSSSSSSGSNSGSWSESSSSSNAGTGNVWPGSGRTTPAPSLNIPEGLCRRNGGVGC